MSRVLFGTKRNKMAKFLPEFSVGTNGFRREIVRIPLGFGMPSLTGLRSCRSLSAVAAFVCCLLMFYSLICRFFYLVLFLLIVNFLLTWLKFGADLSNLQS